MKKEKLNDKLDIEYVTLLEIETFRVVKDMQFEESQSRRQNNFTQHWIAHLCDAYMKSKEDRDEDHEYSGIFDLDEIREGMCAYCNVKIPDAITALWTMLEWKQAANIFHEEFIPMVNFP